MKDKLVFVKTKNTGGCKCSCCDLGFIPSYEVCHIGKVEEESCGVEYVYTFVEEPEEIQSKYSWKKERLSYLCNLQIEDREKYLGEIAELDAWLNRNKPEKWVTCTKDNTQVGDEVRAFNTDILYVIDHIYRELDSCTVWSEKEKRTIVNFNLHSFEINLHGKDKE